MTYSSRLVSDIYNAIRECNKNDDGKVVKSNKQRRTVIYRHPQLPFVAVWDEIGRTIRDVEYYGSRVFMTLRGEDWSVTTEGFLPDETPDRLVPIRGNAQAADDAIVLAKLVL